MIAKPTPEPANAVIDKRPAADLAGGRKRKKSRLREQIKQLLVALDIAT